MFTSHCSRSPFTFFPFLLLFYFGFTQCTVFPSSISQYLFPSSFLIFLVILLFFAIVVVVSVLDLSLGGFTA